MAERSTIATLPNLLGIGRIVATPIIVALLLVDVPGSDLAAGLLFAAAGISDFFDGWIARSRNQVSPLGVFMDLAADKVLVAGVLIAMVEVDLVPTWIAATILIREFVVQAVRQLAAAEDVVISARALGKAKTLTTLAGLGLLFLAADAMTAGPMAPTGTGPALELAGFWLLVLATVLTVVSGLAYLRGAWPILIGASRGGA
ncbi:MAG: CDP-diacylglycerol--glycerol-3-phosphate 3-phosphatidyltransferase [Chloroflexi bacterium]|nr:CDP-diacylglycerol--glycerol-3-phosphate 3-phosphatidyltransferase [Chloroflexota bacterium]MBA3739589.1 CDP-diacylglycerol--glycerol-3-phosphate 3-phosphatidyltransferase [Chloroflexota bacterium]